MTVGQILFGSGVGLLILTVVLALIFWKKPPQYKPEYAVYAEFAEHATQSLRNGYPTTPITIRKTYSTSKGKADENSVKAAKELKKGTRSLSTEPIQETAPLETRLTDVLTDPQNTTDNRTTKLSEVTTELLDVQAESVDNNTTVLLDEGIIDESNRTWAL